jgi:hypothetical protein
MDTKTLCIVGACQNVEAFLPQVLANLTTISSWWKECKIVIYENDSTDNTSTHLHEWKAKGGHIELVQETNLRQRFPNRVERLAYIRNRLLHYVPPFFDYMFVVDMDDVFAKPVQKASFEACFEVKSWDVMTAATDWYYDIWALRVPGLIEFDCWEEYYRLRRIGISEQRAKFDAIETYKEIMSHQTDTLLVHSAFNAGALYKISTIRSCCRYSGKTLDGKEICEHVPFHTCMRSHGGRILFNPKFKL